MLRWRLLLGTLLIAGLVGLSWLDGRGPTLFPGFWLSPVAILVAMLATREVLDLADSAGAHLARWPVYVGNLLIVSCIWLAACLTLPLRLGFGSLLVVEIVFFPLPGLGIAVLLTFIVEIRRYQNPGGTLFNIAAAMFAFGYVGCMLVIAEHLCFQSGVGALASWIIVVKMGDIGAYTVGRLIGRHKLAPVISPGKSIEGAIGGLAFSCIGAWATFRWLTPPLTTVLNEPGLPWGWLVFGLLVGGAGMVGDLAESLLKRDVGRKDSSDWLPGFGGVLDIIDSLLLSAPVAWFCWATGIVGR